jgi:SAM-dependent methyltransferase
MTQQDIRAHYEQEWKVTAERATDVAQLSYSNPVEDAVLYPIYERLLRDLAIRVDGGRVLDVGCGSGRWIRFFLERFKPMQIVGVDYTQASIDLLQRWGRDHAILRLERIDITDPGAAKTLGIEDGFDLINVGNVLFHIPEPEKFATALRNLAALVGPNGRIVTTEYLPRASVRTNWMLVRSRYEFEAAIAAAGLHIIGIRAASFFANDPMGLDGPDQGVRAAFNKVRSGIHTITHSPLNDATREFFRGFLADVERCLLAYCEERIAPVDLPSQKLVVLAKR